MQICLITTEAVVHQVEIPQAPKPVIDRAIRHICKRLGIFPEEIVDWCLPEPCVCDCPKCNN